jgi:amidase
MARSAEDLEALLDVIAGPDEVDMGVGYSLALPAARRDKIGDFRILVIDRHPLVDTEACVAEAIATLAGRLERLGAKVQRQSDLLPELETNARLYVHLLMAAFSGRWPDDLFARFADAAARLSPEDKSLEAEQARGATLSFRAWSAANARRNALRAQWRRLFQDFDAVITPVTPTPAFPHDHEPDQGKRRMQVNGRPTEFFANILWPGVATLPGLPAAALPIGRSPEGLPIGVQIIGPWLEDRTPLKLAQLIEREFGGFAAPAL